MNVVALYLFCSISVTATVSVANASAGVGRLRRRTIRGQESSSSTRQQQQGVRELQLLTIPEEKTEEEVILPAAAKDGLGDGSVPKNNEGGLGGGVQNIGADNPKMKAEVATIEKNVNEKKKKAKKFGNKKEKLE